MIKVREKYKLRGWDALRTELIENGADTVEVQEAEASFQEGIKVLSRLFLSQGVPSSYKNRKRRLKQ